LPGRLKFNINSKRGSKIIQVILGAFFECTANEYMVKYKYIPVGK
jgi:hypothetical protein